MKVTFYGNITKGIYTLYHREVFEVWCKGAKDGEYSITFTKTVHPKTLAQLAYYYAVIIPTALKQMKADGNDTYTVTIGDKEKELPIDEDMVDTILKQACMTKSKAQMSMEEASEFIDRCIMWCARYLGCVIPDPDPLWCEKQIEDKDSG
jgi:hypothetical protein